MNAALFSVLSDLNAFSPKYPMQSPPPQKTPKTLRYLVGPFPNTFKSPLHPVQGAWDLYKSHKFPRISQRAIGIELPTFF